MIDTDLLRLRAVLYKGVRSFFNARQYLEVETPLLISTPVPEPHIIPMEVEGERVLQTSPELCMKQLVAAGNDKIFQLCKCFRKGERSRRHLPEFTMLEWYRTGISYHELMTECRQLLNFLGQQIQQLFGSRENSSKIADSFLPWEKLSVDEAFARFSSVTLREALARDSFELCLVDQIEPHLGADTPTFLYDYPVELGSLAKTKSGDCRYVERFELYFRGLELANGFSELTDAAEQRYRFERDLHAIEAQNRRPTPMPEKFLEALNRMPPTAGIALGIDRLLMILAGKHSIEEVVSFIPEDV